MAASGRYTLLRRAWWRRPARSHATTLLVGFGVEISGVRSLGVTCRCEAAAFEAAAKEVREKWGRFDFVHRPLLR